MEESRLSDRNFSYTGLEEISMRDLVCERRPKRKGPPSCYKPRQRAKDPLPSDGTMKFTVNKQMKESFEQFNRLRGDNHLCDVTIISEGVQFLCHRIVLAASSPYFYAMFTNGMIESGMSEVKLLEIPPDILRIIIDFMYSAEIIVTERNICGLMPAAMMLHMPHIKEACTTFLEHQLDPSNCIGVGKFAQQYNCVDLQARAERYLLKKFSLVRQEEEFLLISQEELVKIVCSSQLTVQCESEVYQAVIDWVAFNCTQRGHHLPSLLDKIRLSNLPPDFIKQQLKHCKVLPQVPEQCMEKLSKLFNELEMHACKDIVPPRESCDKKVIYCIGGYYRESVSIVEFYDPIDKDWKRVADMPHPRSGLSACTIQGLVYAIGGRNNSVTGNQDLSIVDCYDPKTDQWSPCPPMSQARNRVATAVLDNKLYIVGGACAADTFSTVEYYDPMTNSWHEVAPMATSRVAAGVAVVNRFLYVVGGYNGERLRSMEKFYPERNEWQSCPPMSTPRSGAGVCAMDPYIYVAGGFDSETQLQSVERYDTRTNIWEQVAPMLYARSALSMVCLYGKLYILGGYGGNGFIAEVECYDKDRNEWTEVSRMVSGRSGQGVTVGPMP